MTTGGRIYTIYFEKSIDAPRLVRCLKTLRRYLKGPMIIIWDRLATHRSKYVRQFIETDAQIELEFLPAYSPELNPEEYCHGYAKERVRNSVPCNVDELLYCIEHEFIRIRRRPKLIQSFFAHARISLINLSS